MKHAFLITAYNQPQQLFDLVESLRSENSYFYIHFDKKNTEIEDSFYVNKIKSLPNVFILSHRIKVNWGGFSHTKAILALMEEAFKMPDIDYSHTLSGQDFPIRSLSETIRFFEVAKQNGSEYISFKTVPTPTWKGNSGLDRIQRYHLNDYLNLKIRWQQRLGRLFVLLQKVFFPKRPLPREFSQLYGGMVWWSLSGNCVKYILDFLNNNPDFLKRFRYTHCSEEILFQTIVLNSPFAANVVNNHLRYFEMHGSSPDILEEKDFEKIVNSDKLFARKMSEKSLSLKVLLKEYQNKKLAHP